jgi:hypothetical protein
VIGTTSLSRGHSTRPDCNEIIEGDITRADVAYHADTCTLHPFSMLPEFRLSVPWYYELTDRDVAYCAVLWHACEALILSNG